MHSCATRIVDPANQPTNQPTTNQPTNQVVWDDFAVATPQMHRPQDMKGMNVEELWERSVGTWKGLRSSHSIAFGQIGECPTLEATEGQI